MAVMYRKGDGVLQDNKKAVKWYRLAAEQGDSEAQYSLAWMYGNGEGVLQDYKKAVKWYRLAAEQGYSDAQNNLAVRYWLGEGTLQNLILAHVWSNLAAYNGASNAKELREAIAKEMNASQISEAQKLAQKCLSSNYKDCG